MRAKKWAKITIGGIIAGFLLCAATVFIFDPFVQYHKPWFGKVMYSANYSRYLNSGLLKNYNYESICLGSSLTQNFLISDLKKIMPKPIKSSMPGAMAHENNIVINHALRYNKDVKTIFIGLDLFSFDGDINKIGHIIGNGIFPLDMYGDNSFDYLFNLDNVKVAISNFGKIVFNKDKILFDYEHMYEFQYAIPEEDFNATKVINKWQKTKIEKANFYFRPGGFKFTNFEKAKDSFRYNYISLIEDNPQIKFIIFYPPYSILIYKDWEYALQLNEVIEAKKYFAREFAKYLNVEVYDFQDDNEIIQNLNLYIDPFHYHQKINTYIAERIAARDPRYLVDPATYDERLAHFKKYVSEYKTKFDEE